tara:strand:- start:844 stop:1554 length:711 start_codon:yes stop_codon:yes gene_type:complete
MIKFDKVYYIYSFISLISILVLLYFWRKIIELRNNNEILEKKLIILKNENKELIHTINPVVESFENSDIIMNEIFNDIEIDNNDVIVEKNQDDDTIEKIISGDIINNNNNKKKYKNDKIYSNISIEKVKNKKEETIVTSDIVEELPIVSHLNELPIEIANNDDTEDTEIINDLTSIIDKDSDSVISETTSYNKTKLNRMSIDKLRELSTNLELSSEGNKSILIDRLLSNKYILNIQ